MLSRQSLRCFSEILPARSSRSSSLKPRMALRGVRSSWDMLARNSDFSRETSAIWALAVSSSVACDWIDPLPGEGHRPHRRLRRGQWLDEQGARRAALIEHLEPRVLGRVRDVY